MSRNHPEHASSFEFRVAHDKSTLFHYGAWLSHSRAAYKKFFSQLTGKVSLHWANKASTHTPAVTEFAKAINNPSDCEPKMIDLFNEIFVQAAPQNQVVSFAAVKDFDSLLYLLDIIIVQPPSFIVSHDSDGNPTGQPVGVPIHLIFDLLSNTAAGYDLFRRPAFNSAMKNLLNSWGAYLQTPDSTKTLTDADGGWFSKAGLEALENLRGEFSSTYVCPKPEQTNRGYLSWDEFFTREVQDSARPVHFSHDPIINAGIIVSACESTVVRIEYNLQLHNRFWIKGQKYSLYDMLDRDDTFSKAFVGGTAYQAFLNATDYHRWRSPVAGKIKKAVVVPGTYYAVLPDDGADEGDPDYEPGSPYGALIRSQPWLTHSATRALIYIESGNPKIGLVCFIGVGMVEVSTCALSVKAGQDVEKGDELGMFHFGGSSHVLLFGPNAKLTFNDNIVDRKTGEVKVNTHIKVLSALAQVD
ncbi:Phosphatidylserine decarboxylase [Mycena sanguinolenta]|uniref:Phosphatidylserine decarboxylase n=1 Tax=Mycena sanguinolenta TaxID=230812 RepID=A0A8H7DC98_9AGAR|nr:Phosphatidylserine decarboxylase [Mycena sanguinolenta]